MVPETSGERVENSGDLAPVMDPFVTMHHHLPAYAAVPPGDQ
jgi:hypothetical protein